MKVGTTMKFRKIAILIVTVLTLLALSVAVVGCSMRPANYGVQQNAATAAL